MSLVLSESELDVPWELGEDCEMLILLGLLVVGELGTDDGLVADAWCVVGC